jgi:hypothetical protein
MGRIVFNLLWDNRIYDNHRANTKIRDRDSVGGGVTFFYHAMPKTSLLFELSHREFNYSNYENYDSIEQRALVGASWDISALTTGTAKAGLLEKNFNVDAQDGYSGISWEIGARWTPLSYSVIDILSRGRTEESNGSDDYYIDSKGVLIKWAHYWSESVNTVLDVNVTKNAYQPTTREDDYQSIGLQLNYSPRRWLNVGIGFTHSTNQSTNDSFEYEKNVVAVNLTAGL